MRQRDAVSVRVGSTEGCVIRTRLELPLPRASCRRFNLSWGPKKGVTTHEVRRVNNERCKSTISTLTALLARHNGPAQALATAPLPCGPGWSKIKEKSGPKPKTQNDRNSSARMADGARSSASPASIELRESDNGADSKKNAQYHVESTTEMSLNPSWNAKYLPKLIAVGCTVLPARLCAPTPLIVIPADSQRSLSPQYGRI